MSKQKGRKKTTKKTSYSYINKQINRMKEKKAYVIDLTNNFSSIAATWIEQDMTDIDVGSTFGTRDGAKVGITSIRFYGVVSNGDDNNMLRIVVASWDSSTQTPLATNGAVLSSSIIKGSTSAQAIKKKYLDKYYTLDAPNTGEVVQRTVKFFKRFKNPLPIMYSGDGTTGSVKIIISVLSDSGIAPNPGFIAGYFITRYVDL